MGILDSATTAVTGAASSATTAISNVTSASGVGGLVDSVTSYASSFFSGLSATKLPLGNVLSSYATYDYILSLSVISKSDVNNPDKTYMAGKPQQIICKTGGIEPNNRVQTSYGKFDFFMDNLTVESIIGMINTKGSMTTTVSFNVYEPYSLGVFMLSMQQAAAVAGYKNWRAATFLLKIEFRGNKENGLMESVLASTRYIPVNLTTITIKANEKGTTYNVSGFTISGKAATSQYSDLRIDTAIKGKTVQEVLQTGEQSLQAVVNKKLKEYVKTGDVAVADEIIILFPKNIASDTAATQALSNVETASSATTNPNTSSNSSIYKKLGVIEGTNKTSVQSESDCNELGKTSMGYDLSKKGDASSVKSSAVQENGVWVNGNITADPKEGTLRFAQGADIMTVINQVMLLSDYPEQNLKSTAVNTTTGMRTWWRIDTQVYYIDTDANLDKTGDYPRIIVYRVVPYDAHPSKLPAAGTKVKGLDAIKQLVVKRYDYLYTGKNTEVLKFDIDFSMGFANVLAADSGLRNMDKLRSSQDADAVQTETDAKMMPDGLAPPTQAGSNTTMTRPTGLSLPGDKLGGGGQETLVTRAAKVWEKALKNPNDMVVLNMEIVGDPYWIPQSGLGNYTSSPVAGIKDLNKDGSVNYQSSEVDILVNFRSPLDINQTSGLYTFGGLSQNAPVIGWSGLYIVNRTTSVFNQGSFRQTLKGMRRPMQEAKVETAASKSLGSDQPAPNTPAPKDASNTPQAGGDGTWSI